MADQPTASVQLRAPSWLRKAAKDSPDSSKGASPEEGGSPASAGETLSQGDPKKRSAAAPSQAPARTFANLARGVNWGRLASPEAEDDIADLPSPPMQRSTGLTPNQATRPPATTAFAAIAAKAKITTVPASEDEEPPPAWVAPTTPYDPEQLAVIQSDARIVVAEAKAGSGKTTTGVGYAAARPEAKMLYLVFGRANAIEARRKFPPWVDVLTTHTIARRTIKPQKERVPQKWTPMVLQAHLGLKAPRLARMVLNGLAAFWGSCDKTIEVDHIEDSCMSLTPGSSEVEMALTYARSAWEQMCERNSSFPIPHDAYLKMFALQAPKLPYTHILLDEFQDANPVTVQLAMGQMENSNLLVLGDSHQGIFGFRGSINGMSELKQVPGARAFELTRSFRFGRGVAKLANMILGEFMGEKNLIKGMGKDGAWVEKGHAYISRTNAELFRVAAEKQGKGIHWVGGIGSYNLEALLDVYRLYAGKREEISNKLIDQRFRSFEEYESYGEGAKDGEAILLAKLVRQFKHETPRFVEDLKTNAVEREGDAEIVLTTAHRSKGLEWDCVRMGEDFTSLASIEDSLAQGEDFDPQEANLLYVMLTRARRHVSLNKDMATWMDNLAEYRQARRHPKYMSNDDVTRQFRSEMRRSLKSLEGDVLRD